MSVAELLEGKRVCVCGGSGGVGKTTTSAAIALGMAARGAKVVVNDIGGAVDGSGQSNSAADRVVAEITAAGGEATGAVKTP